MSRSRLIALLLALVTLAVYLPVVRHGFIVYDDGDYVTQNEIVQAGLTPAGIKWAFTTFQSANWHPLTWLSLMSDCEMFGVNAGGTHLINVLLHAANTVLLFALMLQFTQRKSKSDADSLPPALDTLWPAAFIAALFALHPLHVESVAWASERKDLLCAFFGLLALLCYVRYAANDARRRSVPYWLALIFFACGLMSKPMLVTLPFVLLLLDYWPLQRASLATVRGLLLEKIPFFLLTAASCVVTYFAQNTGAVRSLRQVPLVYRLENAPVALATYLLKLIWPVKLAVIYPMPQSISYAALVTSLVILISLTIAVWLARKKNPYLLIGWLWFLGTLVPVLGLVKVGDAAMADRYTYLPSIGIFMAVAFGAQQIARRRALPQFLLPAAAVAILAVLTIVTERQLQFWRNDESLFKHAVEVTTNNADAEINYGVALENEGRRVEAREQYQRAVMLANSSYMAHVDYGDLILEMGDTNGALAEFQQAIQLAPNPAMSSELHTRLGNVLAGMGRFTEATNEFFQAMRLAPNASSPRLHLGIVFAAQGDIAEATNEFSEAMQHAPGDPAPLVEWGRALLQQGRDAAAMDQLNQALQLAPDNFQTLTFIAHVLASDDNSQIRNTTNALTYAQKADALTDGGQPLVKDALGMAYAESGQFDEAQQAATDAIRLATAAGMKSETIAAMQQRLRLYQRHQPWRESFALPVAK